MTIDLKTMSRKELEKLARDVEKALDKLRKKDLKKVRQEMEKLAAAHGVSVEEVMGDGAKPVKKPNKAKAKSPARYANPADASQTWTGRGRQPDWFKAAIAQGISPDAMEL